MDCEFYLGPWQLSDGDERVWHPPAGSIGNICFRGGARNDEAGPGLFVLPKGARLSGYDHLGSGDPRDLMPSARARTAFESVTGKTATGNSLSEWIRGAIGLHADMGGGPAPMRPNRKRRLGFYLAGERVLDVPFDLATDEGLKARERMQEAYRKVRLQAREGKIAVKGVADAEFHRRLLSAWGEQYKVNNPEDVWIPADLPRETRLQHGTTLTDDFNRADSTTSPGSSSEGWSWVEEHEALGISSNQIYNTGAGFTNAAARADSALGSDDHYAQIQRTDTTSGTANVGPCVRFESGARSYYFANWRDGGGAGIYRVVTGSFSQLTSDLTAEAAANTYKLDMAGNDLEAFRNGVSDSTYTDTDATLDGNLYTGCALREFGNTGDNFEASDGLGGGTVKPILYYHQMAQAAQGA